MVITQKNSKYFFLDLSQKQQTSQPSNHLQWVDEIRSCPTFAYFHELIYCVHPIDIPFQDWDFMEKLSLDTNEDSVCHPKQHIPSLITLYAEEIRKMALKARKAFLSGHVKLYFEMYPRNESFYLCEGGHMNGAHFPKPYYDDNFGAIHNSRFDIIMTGNQADVYGLDQTLCQVKPLLKFPSENSSAYVLTHHRGWRVNDIFDDRLNPSNDNPIFSLPPDIENEENVMYFKDKRYRLMVCDIENQARDIRTDLFTMKDIWLRNVRWRWQCIHYDVIDTKFDFPTNQGWEMAHGSQITEVSPCVNRATKNGKGHKHRLKNGSTSYDISENSINNIKFSIANQTELTGIIQKFSDSKETSAENIYYSNNDNGNNICNRLLSAKPLSYKTIYRPSANQQKF